MFRVLSIHAASITVQEPVQMPAHFFPSYRPMILDDRSLTRRGFVFPCTSALTSASTPTSVALSLSLRVFAITYKHNKLFFSSPVPSFPGPLDYFRRSTFFVSPAHTGKAWKRAFSQKGKEKVEKSSRKFYTTKHSYGLFTS